MYSVILSITIVATNAGVEPVTPMVQVILNPGNYKQATGTCNGLNDGVWHLPGPNKDLSLVTLIKTVEGLMESHNLQSVWIRLQRKDFPEWKNLDNTTFEGRVQTYGNPQKTCVLMKLQHEALVSETCQTHGYGYTCQLNACSRCPSSISPSNCFVKNGKCYFVGCDVATWFNAVNLCKEMGGELATFNTAYQLQKCIAGIKSRRENVCKNFWVGLRKTDWYFSDANGESLPNRYQWYSDNPRSEDGCAVLKKFPSGYYWESVNCREIHATVCLKRSVGDRTTAQFTTEKTMGSKNDRTTARIASGKNADKYARANCYFEGGIYLRLDFIVAMILLIFITLFVYASCLILQRRRKVTKCVNDLSSSRKDPSGRVNDTTKTRSLAHRLLKK